LTETKAPEAEPAAIWVNRITHYSVEPTESLLYNPSNFRRHPVQQKRVFGGAASEIGLVAPIIQNDRTGYLLDGHMRVEEAMFRGIPELPVIHVDLSPEEEDVALATLDAISSMAFEDAAMKAELLKRTHSNDGDLSDYLARELERQQAEIESGEDLDALGEEYGEHDPTAFWPVIRIRVPDDVRARFISYFNAIPRPTDHEKLSAMLDVCRAPMVDPDDVSEVASD
jgi:hypothetical protein